jgi:hypothetical protein
MAILANHLPMDHINAVSDKNIGPRAVIIIFVVAIMKLQRLYL